MNPIIKNSMALLGGLVIGNMVNMGLVELGHVVFPLEGVDTNNLESLAQAYSNLSFEYFIFPFLAHAGGTFAGAYFAARISDNRKKLFAWIIGGFFLLGGIAVNFMIPGPTWFTILDLVVAYLPMAWLGYRLVVPTDYKDGQVIDDGMAR